MTQLSAERQRDLLRQMWLIRFFEEQAMRLSPDRALPPSIRSFTPPLSARMLTSFCGRWGGRGGGGAPAYGAPPRCGSRDDGPAWYHAREASAARCGWRREPSARDPAVAQHLGKRSR